METLQLRLDEDSTNNGFFEAVFFLEDPVFWEVCHLGWFLKKKRKIRTHLDLLSIPRLWGENVKTFRCSLTEEVAFSRCDIQPFYGVSYK